MRLARAILPMLILAACTTQAAPSTAAGSIPPASQPPPTTTPSAAGPATPAPTTDSEPVSTGHPAAGLALVRFPEPSDVSTQVFVVEADGTLRQVTGLTGTLGASFPVWSRDGDRLAFTGPKRGETTVVGMLAVVNADGSDERQVAEGQLPAWSPDGTRIAFEEVDDVSGTDHSFYLVDPDTGEITDLGLGGEPRWVADDRIVHTANSYAGDGRSTQHLLFLDLGSGEQRLVADWARGYPSPDGSSMLLVEQENPESPTTWLADADGQPTRELARGGDPVWSPDGEMVALLYDFDQDANPVYRVVDLDGNVIVSDIVGATPTWSPDGTRLALEVYRPAHPVIQVVDLATGEVVWEEEGRQPAWRP